jgi:urease accessory protein
MTTDITIVRDTTAHNTVFGAIGAVAVALMVASPVAASDGPGAAVWAGLTHPLLGVDHVLAMVTVGILAMTMARPLAAPATFVGAMTVGGALGMAGLGLPGREFAVALSVAALGAALVAGAGARPEWSLGLIGLAGFVHGHAHGAEAPTAAHPAVYVAGFVAATITLHLAGVGIGVRVRSSIRTRAAVGALVLGAGVGLAAAII